MHMVLLGCPKQLGVGEGGQQGLGRNLERGVPQSEESLRTFPKLDTQLQQAADHILPR